MKRELVGEEVTVSGPPQAIVALACEAAKGIANGAEMEEGDVQALEATLGAAVADMEHAEIIEARIVLVEAGVDIMLGPQGGDAAATIEHRA